MTSSLILASTSNIRKILLRQANIDVETIAARIDEASIKQALLSEQATHREMADTLAEMKARKVSDKHPDAMVIGCDQILSFGNTIVSKPRDASELRDQLTQLRGRSHELLSAVVIYEGRKPVWREIGSVQLTMRDFSDRYLDLYIDRNWERVQHSVGGYNLEEEGVRLFSSIKGDYFTVLGLPLLDLISYLTTRGVIDG